MDPLDDLPSDSRREVVAVGAALGVNADDATSAAGGLSLDGLSFKYRKSGPWALDQITCAVPSRAIAVLGPNGAGKSTLFGVLSTVLRPVSGSFTVGSHGGVHMAAREVDEYRRVIGVLPQDFRALGGYTCTEYLEYVAWLRRVPASAARSQAAEALSAVALTDSSTKKVRELSGGMRRRLGLAQALVSRAQLLLLDEPTVGLDPVQRSQFLALLASVTETATVCLATHLVEDVALFADDVVLLVDGRLGFAGTIESFCNVRQRQDVSAAAVERAYFAQTGATPR